MEAVIFDRAALRMRRARAARAITAHDFLLRETGERLADRLSDMARSFPCALDLGCHHGMLASLLQERGGIETLVQADFAEAMVRQAAGVRLVADEERLPFADDSFDLVICNASLHWVNDLPGALIQIRRVLKPDGLFLALMPGGETLTELREALTSASLAEEGGISPRISPFIDVRDAGMLLQRAGFALPVVDAERLDVRYENALALMRDLRGMGEANALIARRKHFTRRSSLFAAAEAYAARHLGPDGRISATFELVTLTAWKPHSSQQQPLARGSAQVSLTQALKD